MTERQTIGAVLAAAPIFLISAAIGILQILSMYGLFDENGDFASSLVFAVGAFSIVLVGLVGFFICLPIGIYLMMKDPKSMNNKAI